MKRILAAVLAVLLLVGCGKAVPASAPTTTAAPPVDVSPLAEKAYMENYQSIGWVRTYPAERIMVHFSSAVVTDPDDPYDYDAVVDIFEEYEVGPHYLIDREGGITCLIPENLVAPHAGKGRFGGDEKYTNKMNEYAIGIELIAIGSESDMAQYLTPAAYRALAVESGFTEAQYTALNALIADIAARRNIPLDRSHVFGHDEYQPGKTDPGELFDWSNLPCLAQ